MPTLEEIKTIVESALTILENDYDIVDLENIGMPTVDEISTRIFEGK